MTNNKEFVLWFGGFIDAVEGIPTQTQWDLIKSKLSEVSEPITWPIGVPNTEPMPLLDYKSPWENPYKVTCETDTNGVILTSTSGSGSTYNIPPTIITHGTTTWTSIPNKVFITYTSGSKE